MSPTARSRYRTPSTIAEIPIALRAVVVSWATTAATPAKTRPTPSSPAANATEPAPERPSSDLGNPAAMIAKSTTCADPTSMRAAASEACRPTAVAWISSARPPSSSARVCRTTRKTLINATAIAAEGSSSLAVIAP
jgi:hypothetical protein